jgi:chromosome segregation ATPase
MLKALTKTAFIIVAVSSLVACVNLEAVRDYSKAASDLTGGKEIASRWGQSNDVLNMHTAAIDIKFGPRRSDEDQKLAEMAIVELNKIHDVLGQYFSAVAELAADDVPKVEKQAESISGAIKTIDNNFSEADQTAFKAIVNLLALPLDAYRHRELRKLLKSQQSNVDKLLSVLDRAVLVIDSDLKAEQAHVESRFAQLLGNITDPGIRFVIRHQSKAEQEKGYPESFSAIKKYRAAIAVVRSKHKQVGQNLESDKETLERTLRSLREARDQIRAARSAIDKAFN